MSFDEQFVEGVLRHMNNDHADDAVRIVRVLGGRPGAERAEAVGLDSAAIHFVAHEGDTRTDVTIAFAAPVTDPRQVRQAVAELTRRATQAAG